MPRNKGAGNKGAGSKGAGNKPAEGPVDNDETTVPGESRLVSMNGLLNKISDKRGELAFSLIVLEQDTNRAEDFQFPFDDMVALEEQKLQLQKELEAANAEFKAMINSMLLEATGRKFD